MNIVRTQEDPHPIYEVQGYEGPKDFHEIIRWCHSTGLPKDLTLSFEGTQYRFRSRPERVCWALGFDKAFDLLYDEPELPVHIDNGTAFLRLGDAESKGGLEQLKDLLLQELYLAKWPDHLDEIKVYASESYSLIIKRDVWNALSLRQKQMTAARCQGFCEALDEVY